MNIVYIIGNGFDLNLGLKTRYIDFYDHYKTIESKHAIIKNLKKSISSNYESWADLELALGRYLETLTNEDEFDIVFDDLIDSLGDYLQQVEQNFKYEDLNGTLLHPYFAKPELSLPKADSDLITSYKRDWATQDWNIQIITLNYTRSIERLLNFQSDHFEIGKHHRHLIRISSIEHLHGYVDDRMIMGVNDLSQLKNESFHKNSNVVEAIVKASCNKAQKHQIDSMCVNQIQNAQLICIYGCSIGDTDKCWWELIGEQLVRGCRLIIFTRGEEINQRKGYKRARIERIMKQYFLDKTNLDDKEKSDAAQNVFIAVNSNMFNI